MVVPFCFHFRLPRRSSHWSVVIRQFVRPYFRLIADVLTGDLQNFLLKFKCSRRISKFAPCFRKVEFIQPWITWRLTVLCCHWTAPLAEINLTYGFVFVWLTNELPKSRTLGHKCPSYRLLGVWHPKSRTLGHLCIFYT